MITQNTIRTDQIRTLKHLILHRRIPQRQPQRLILALDIHILERNARTRMLTRTEQRRRNIIPRRPRKVRPGDVRDCHLGGVAVTTGLGVNALRYLNWESDVGEIEVAECDVPDVAAAAASSVAVSGGVGWYALPCLDVGAVHRVDEGDVFECAVLDVVWHGGILADGADGHAAGVMACDVPNVEVGGVAFGGVTIVAVVDDPVLDEDVVGIPAVATIGIDCAPFVIAGGIHVYVA